MMATRVTRRNKAVLSGGLHPQYVGTVETLAHCGRRRHRPPGAPPSTPRTRSSAAIDADTACVVVQTPNVFGTATDVSKIAAGRPGRRRPADRGHHRGGLATAC